MAEVETMTTKNPVSRERGAESTESKRSPASNVVHALFGVVRRALNKAEDKRDVVERVDGVEHRGAWTMRIEVEADQVDGGFIAECPDVPGAIAQGETEKEAVESLIEAINAVVEVKIERFFESVTLDATEGSGHGRARYTVPM